MEDTENFESHQPGSRSVLLGCVAVIALILLGWALRATEMIVMPIVFAIFLALLVAPLDRWGRERAPRRFRWLGHVASMGAILLTLFVFVGFIWLSAQQVVERFPLQSGENGTLLSSFGTGSEMATGPAQSTPEQAASGEASETTSKSSDAEGGSSGTLSRLGKSLGLLGTSLSDRLANWAAAHAMSILDAAGKTFGAATMVFFLTLLMLIEGPVWRQKMTTLLGEKSQRDAMESTDIIAERLRRYLWVRTIIGFLTAALYVVWLWIFGVDLLIVWGVLAFLLNYIPTVGSLVAGILAVTYTFVQKDFGSAMAVGGGILLLEQIMGNYVDPRVQGRQISLSPLVVLVVLLFWGWLWGIAGALLAVPITISITIVAAHVKLLRPVGLLLSNEIDNKGLDRMTKERQ